MSSTSGKADALARYYTDPVVAAACVATLDLPPGIRIADGHAGAGAWLDAAIDRQPLALAWALDLDPGAPAVQRGQRWACSVGDFLGAWPFRPPDLLLGNPPYSVDRREVATAHLRRALEIAPIVAWLLPLDILGGHRAGAGRWRHLPTDVSPIDPRPSFTGGSTDSGEYGFMVFHRDRPDDDTIRWRRAITWREKGRSAR